MYPPAKPRFQPPPPHKFPLHFPLIYGILASPEHPNHIPPATTTPRRTPVRFLPVLAFCACLLLQPFPAKALTDEDHTRYAREFPAYAQAEQRLNAAWKQLRQRLSKEDFQSLLAEQRVWINSTRDAEAKAIAGPGPFANAAPLASAYAAVTVKRAEALEARLKAAAPKAAPPAQATSATPAAPAAPAKNATAPQPAPPAKAAPAPQAAPAVKGAQPGQATGQTAGQTANQTPPVVKGSPAKGSPAAQSAPPAGKGAPSLQAPAVPLAAGASEQRGSIVGSYGSGANLVEIRANDKEYYVAVSTAAPDARWVCEMEGLGVVEGDILRVTSDSSGQSVVVPIQIKGDSLIIPPTQAATCGFGGTVEGVYKKK